MEEQYSISEIARLFGVSTQTLRYYDKIGLFKPEYTDRHTGYRFYGYKQFFALSMIIQLKRLNFSLERIKQYSSTKDIDLFEANLIKEKELIRQEIDQLRNLEETTNRLLKKIQISKDMPTGHDCEIQEEPDRFQYEINVNYEIKDLYQYIHLLYESYIKSTFKTNITAHGEIILKIFKENLCEKQFHVYNSIGFFIDASQYSNMPARNVSHIPSGKFAACLHVGAYDTIHRSYQKLYDFIQKNGYSVCGDSLEYAIISVAMTDNPNNFITQIQIPIQK